MRDSLRLLPGGRRLLVLAVPVLLGVGLVAGAFLYAAAASPAAVQPEVAGPDLGVPPPAGLLIDVIGAVDRPGLYRMNRGDRVYDAIAAAGGLTGDADPTRLPDMAGRLRDGEQIKVPFAKSTAGSLVITRTNLNTATVEELEFVPGFSAAFAQEVVDYRINFGGFQNLRELVEVLGMSESEFVIARRYLTL
ncbi:MAG: competence protein ComEA [Chloroflexi bacterium]|nr:MAG: competence protein ComEA [Chloroflexota bacterium]